MHNNFHTSLTAHSGICMAGSEQEEMYVIAVTVFCEGMFIFAFFEELSRARTLRFPIREGLCCVNFKWGNRKRLF